ncbi:MAG TPA: hypothetical protein VNK96_07060 [Fimbriimonadales bacterium]|nr:hypothetical protein [Fimbriimonadales bacterium]
MPVAAIQKPEGINHTDTPYVNPSPVQFPSPAFPPSSNHTNTLAYLISLLVTLTFLAVVFFPFFTNHDRNDDRNGSEPPIAGSIPSVDNSVHNSIEHMPAVSDSTPPMNSSSQVLIITPEELITAFEENPVRAKDWLKGKIVQVTGELSHVSNNLFGGDRVAVILLVNLDRFMKPTVIFWYDGSFRDQVVSKLSKGDIVTCQGIFDEEELFGDLTFKGLSLR